MVLDELAKRIDAHLRRFEADREGINAEHALPGSRIRGRRRYQNAGAFHDGRYVVVRYTAEGEANLTENEARAYLAWLDAGHVGRHFEQATQKSESALKQAKRNSTPQRPHSLRRPRLRSANGNQ